MALPIAFSAENGASGSIPGNKNMCEFEVYGGGVEEATNLQMLDCGKLLSWGHQRG